MKININTESFQDSLTEALLKTVFKDREPSDTEMAAWVKQNHDHVVDGIESALPGILYRMQNPPKRIEKPVLEFKNGANSKIRLWILDAHQTAVLADHRSFRFGGDDTGSLIYEELGMGHRATEYNIDNSSTWEWIQKWMSKGMEADKLVKP